MSYLPRSCEVVYASEIHVEKAQTFCREAAHGFEGAFEALTNEGLRLCRRIVTLPGVGFIRLSGLVDGELKCEVRKLEKYLDGSVPRWRLTEPKKFAIYKKTGYWIDD